MNTTLHPALAPQATIVQLAQGSPEWHAYRQSRRNASESAAVLGLSPWMTPYQLWLVKTGRTETRVTHAMQRGTDLEPLARAAYEEQTGLVMQPLVLEAGDYSASLDGMTLEGEVPPQVLHPAQRHAEHEVLHRHGVGHGRSAGASRGDCRPAGLPRCPSRPARGPTVR